MPRNQFFMGHKGDMEARYTTNKGRLTEQMTEDMRRAFEQSQAFLSTDAMHDTKDNKRRMLIGMWRQQAKMYGLDPDSMFASGTLDGTQSAPARQPAAMASAQDGGAGRNGDMVAATAAQETNQSTPSARRKVARAADAVPATTAGNMAPKQSPFESKIVDDEDELLAGTAEGWNLVKDLPGDRFLIRRKVLRP